MSDGPDGRVPRRRMRGPDSIWERYLTGQLSLEDKETLPALIKEIHREIAEHLGHKVDAEPANPGEPTSIDLPPTPPPPRNDTPIVDINVRRNQILRRRRSDPRHN